LLYFVHFRCLWWDKFILPWQRSCPGVFVRFSYTYTCGFISLVFDKYYLKILSLLIVSMLFCFILVATILPSPSGQWIIMQDSIVSVLVKICFEVILHYFISLCYRIQKFKQQYRNRTNQLGKIPNTWQSSSRDFKSDMTGSKPVTSWAVIRLRCWFRHKALCFTNYYFINVLCVCGCKDRDKCNYKPNLT
jgi:hypothetical protein